MCALDLHPINVPVLLDVQASQRCMTVKSWQHQPTFRAFSQYDLGLHIRADSEMMVSIMQYRPDCSDAAPPSC